MLVSHNTFTYMKPIKWWMNLLTPFTKCQKSNVKKQDKYPVEVADIRIRYAEGTWYVCHGPVRYCTFNHALYQLRQTNIRKVRLIIEGNYTIDILVDLELFLKLNSNFTFYEGRDKTSWKKVLDLPSLKMTQMVGSIQSKYGKVFPFLYYLLNKKKLKKMMFDASFTEDLIAFDFI